MLGGLDKLVDIISPAGDDTPIQKAALNTLQRSLQGVQAALEDKQASVFGHEVSPHPTRQHRVFPVWYRLASPIWMHLVLRGREAADILLAAEEHKHSDNLSGLFSVNRPGHAVYPTRVEPASAG